MFSHKVSVPLVTKVAFILHLVCLCVNIATKMTGRYHYSICPALLWMVSMQ